MSKKKFIGQLISIKYSDRPIPISGFVIDYNEEFTLLKYNPCDYITDGYIILQHKNIEGFRRDENEKFKEKVIILKEQHSADFSDFLLTDLETILSYLTKKYEVFQFELTTEKKCYLGKLKSFTKAKFTISYLNPEGKWEGKRHFRPSDVRTIEFDTDYINSLKLISQHRRSIT